MITKIQKIELGMVDKGTKKLSRSEDFEGAFYSYLHDLRSFEPLENADKESMILQIAESMVDYSANLFVFGIAQREFIRIIEQEIIGNKLAPEDFFVGSSVKNANVSQDKDYWKKHLSKVQHLYNQVVNSFNQHNSDIVEKKVQLLEVISGITLTFDVLEDIYMLIWEMTSVICHDPKFKQEKFDIENYSESVRHELSEKYLIPEADLNKNIRNLVESHDNLIKLKHAVLESHLRLVISVAQKFRHCGLPFSDIIQEGNIGLMRAIDKFDPYLGHKFSTYAVWWIKQNIIRGIAEQSRTIRIPAHMIATINQINRVEQKLLQEFGREPESDEIATVMNVPIARVNAIRRMARQAISLQSPIGKDGDNSVLEDILEDQQGVGPSSDMSKENTYKMLYKMLDMLTEREREIIVLRFGLFGRKPAPLAELSDKFDLTRERIRQLELKILAKLRTPERIKFLDHCIQTGDK